MRKLVMSIGGVDITAALFDTPTDIWGRALDDARRLAAVGAAVRAAAID